MFALNEQRMFYVKSELFSFEIKTVSFLFWLYLDRYNPTTILMLMSVFCWPSFLCEQLNGYNVNILNIKSVHVYNTKFNYSACPVCLILDK